MISGARVEIFDTLDSTSLEAKRRAASGETGPLWIIALEQTSGYGRRGAAWVQEHGDVAATFLFRPDAPAADLPQLSFVAALAVADAIGRLACAPLTLKWPNDILANGGKLAGILLELVGPEPPLIALGIGVNVVSAPSKLDYPTARLLDLVEGAPPHPRAFVQAIDEAFEVRRRKWEKEGFADVRREWLERAERRGRSVKVKLPGETLEGVFEDLDSTGALVLDLGGERRTIAAGSILAPRFPL